MQLADLESEISTRQDEIRKLERRRDRLRAEDRDQAELVSRSAAMAQRAAPSPSGLGDAAEHVAAVQRELASRARVEAKLAQRPRSQPTATLTTRSATRSASPPKAPGGSCVCGGDCDAYPPLDPDAGAERARADDLISLGYSREMAQLAQREITRYGGPVVSVR